jgi:hypothetical protein
VLWYMVLLAHGRHSFFPFILIGKVATVFVDDRDVTLDIGCGKDG